MFDLFPEMQSIWTRLAVTLFHFLWQGTLFSLCLLTLLKIVPFNKPQSRYIVYLVALLLMALCPAVTFCLVDLPVEINNSPSVALVTTDIIPPAENIKTKNIHTSTIPLAQTKPVSTIVPKKVHKKERVIPVVQPGPSNLQTETEKVDVTVVKPITWQATLHSFAPLFLFFWIAGVLFFSLRLLIGWRAMTRWRRVGKRSVEAEKIVTRLSRTLCIKTMPLVLLCSEVTEAMAVGFLKPMILIPTSWAIELTPQMLESVIAHEFAHIRRWDLWINLFQRLVETLLFYHPAVWMISNQIRVEREHCCDDLAVAMTGSRTDFVETLEYVATLKLAGTPALATAMGGRKMKLLERVKHLLGQNENQPRTGWGIAGLTALAVPALLWACSFAVMPAVADDDAPKEERREVAREGDRERPEARRDRERPPRGERERGDRERSEREERREREPRDGDRDRSPRREGDRERGERGPRDDDRPERPDFRRRPRGERDNEDRPPRRERDERREGDREGRRPERRDDFRRGGPDDLIRLIRELRDEVRMLREEVEELREEISEEAEEEEDDEEEAERERRPRRERRFEGKPPRERDSEKEDRPRRPREDDDKPAREPEAE